MSVVATQLPELQSPAPAVRPWQVLVVLLLIVYPLVVPDFWRLQVGAYAFILGTIALSLMFLAGYGGMVSLAQMTVAGVAGYMLAIFGDNSAGLGFIWPWWLAIPLSLFIAVLFSAVTGALSVRTEGIYTIMITLAIAVAFFYFARQNYHIFNGFTGFAGLKPPALFGVDWREPLHFYYLCLGVAALCYAAVAYAARSTFGVALQAIRENPRRMQAIGFNVKAHRIAAYVFAGVIASLGGVLLVWFNGRISPGTVSVGPVIDILVIAVIGGLGHPLGAFLGAIVYVLLDNFAIDLIDRERFNLVIGGVFLAIVLFSPDGILGLWEKAKNAARRQNARRHELHDGPTRLNRWSDGRQTQKGGRR